MRDCCLGESFAASSLLGDSRATALVASLTTTRRQQPACTVGDLPRSIFVCALQTSASRRFDSFGYGIGVCMVGCRSMTRLNAVKVQIGERGSIIERLSRIAMSFNAKYTVRD